MIYEPSSDPREVNYYQNGLCVTWEVETGKPLPLSERFFPVQAKELDKEAQKEIAQLDQDFIDSLKLS